MKYLISKRTDYDKPAADPVNVATLENSIYPLIEPGSTRVHFHRIPDFEKVLVRSDRTTLEVKDDHIGTELWSYHLTSDPYCCGVVVVGSFHGVGRALLEAVNQIPPESRLTALKGLFPNAKNQLRMEVKTYSQSSVKELMDLFCELPECKLHYEWKNRNSGNILKTYLFQF